MLLCFSLTAACGDDSSECEEIVEACHASDPGSGPIHECHENAEEKWSKSECATNRQMCLAVCQGSRDAGAGG
jgi:hypothetical protein